MHVLRRPLHAQRCASRQAAVKLSAPFQSPQPHQHAVKTVNRPWALLNSNNGKTLVAHLAKGDAFALGAQAAHQPLLQRGALAPPPLAAAIGDPIALPLSTGGPCQPPETLQAIATGY